MSSAPRSPIASDRPSGFVRWVINPVTWSPHRNRACERSAIACSKLLSEAFTDPKTSWLRNTNRSMSSGPGTWTDLPAGGVPVRTIYQERYMGVVHGSGDDNVQYQGTERLVKRLVELGKPFDLMVYPNRTHAIAEGPGTTVHVYQVCALFRDAPGAGPAMTSTRPTLIPPRGPDPERGA